MLSRTLMLLCATLIGCNEAKQDTSNTDTSDTIVEESKTIWNGPKITFTKEDSVDHTESQNQDFITDSVILTRQMKGSLINIATESSAVFSSPDGTEWALGTTNDLDNLEFQSLKEAANNLLKQVPGKSYVLHLIEDDIYIDVTFISWTSGGSGGGFSYERTTEN
ncbi:MAG: hypothetical protein CL916_09660 [Deltaproteobacteria bacterium]|nr:hypothetical protein [Deltaproteobacteria bacterium]